MQDGGSSNRSSGTGTHPTNYRRERLRSRAKRKIYYLSPAPHRTPQPVKSRKMDAASLALGIAALLAAFDGAVNGYLRIEEFFDDNTGCLDLGLAYHVQKHRLGAWGDYFKVHDETGCLLLKESENTKTLISKILARISANHEAAQKFLTRYAMESKDSPPSPKNEAERFQLESTFISSLSKLQISKKQKSRFRWVIKDRKKFAEIVNTLKEQNDELYAVLSPRDTDTLIRTLSSYVLAAINSIESLKTLQSVSRDVQTLVLLGLSAKLKEMEKSTDTGESVKHLDKLSLKISSHSYRAFGWYHDEGAMDEAVWVEWRYVTPMLSPSDQTELTRRIQTLGAMLTAVTLSELRIPRCLGIFEDTDYASNPTSQGLARTGFVYAFPGEFDPFKPPKSLLDIISETKEAPFLGDRFRLAFTLASSLSLLHASNWLHKSFRGDNILFFRDKKEPRPRFPRLQAPYLAGFEFSRRVGDSTLGYRPTGSGELDYYYHPDVVEHGFTKARELYSLGVVLYEIAWWRPLGKKLNPGKKDMTLDAYRELLIANLDQVGSMMGEIYRDVVGACLTCDFPDDEEDFARAVLMKVIHELETCNA